ncbi:ABC transporter substrate-binding protein [Halobacterium zhouii]|uniref:ABC transporter substrate-binding protein n=1 Tax=Halobacterium zhouii TaxID=2902624 RepID=UPI001E2ABC55|nr:ABC transporter substrate-binding protein [Halobacterium zhouii]
MVDTDNLTDEELSGPTIGRRATISLLGSAGLGSIAGCLGGGGDEPSTDDTSQGGSVKRGGRLKAGWYTGSIDVLDPPYISVGQYFQVAANVFSGLVTLEKDLTIRGDLAKDWTVKNNGKTITFDLREGVKFHNGTEFTSADVEYTLRRTIKQDTPAASKLSSLQPIDDGGVETPDDYTVTLNFTHAMAPALVYLTRGPGRAATIVCKEAIEKMGADQYGITPVGTGPFEVASHSIGSKLKLDAFDDYFGTDENGKSLPYLDGIDIKPIPEAATLVSALQSGDIDFANLVPLQNVSQVDSASGVNALRAPGINWYGFAMNQRREPFGDVKVRKGIAKVIDNQAYIDTAFFGNATVARGPINKGTNWVYREDKPDTQAYDRKEGKRLLEEAGASSASFSILTTSSSLRSAKALRQQLNAAGLDVTIEQVTSSTYWNRYQKGNYDATISGSVGDPDPDQSLYNFYRLPSKDGVWNWVDYQDQDVHNWLEEQRRELDREKRAETLQRIEDRLIEEVPHAYLMHQDDIAGKNDSVKGFTHIPFLRNFHQVWLDE